MTTRRLIGEFLTEKKLGLVGASRGGHKFGNKVLKELSSKGYEIIPVHPEAEMIDGVPCVRSVADLPADVHGLILVVPPAASEQLVAEAAARGIRRVWLQQGAESDAVLARCIELGVAAVAGECILMFAEPTAFVHKAHRWIWGVVGRLPQ